MKVLVYKNYEEMSRAAALIMAGEILSKENCVLGLATGSTPVGMYKELIRLYEEGILDFSTVRSFNLDEYLGLDGTHPQSYRYFMNEQLFDHVNIDKANTHVPSGVGDDLEAMCADYEAQIKAAGGIDLQVLGIGSNGHIAFNEPADSYTPATRVVNLTASTIADNKRFFEKEEDVPRQAVSMGIGSIMAARKIILLANGANKAKAVREMVYGDITPQLPASALRMHDNAIIMVDEAAASLL